MITNPHLQNILTNAADISLVAEFYSPDTAPTADGFDPNDAVGCYAAVAGITFMGKAYKRLISKFGSIRRTITSEINSTSVTFSNISREISAFEFDHGFEGLIMVIRLISRELSTSLDRSQVLFAGRCEKPKSGNKNSLTVSANFILDSLDVMVPRRKFAPTDYKGRVPSDPEFEGFIHMPQYGVVVYSVRQKRGGILGFLGFKKSVIKTLQYSSYSDLDANKPVPEVFGRAQLLGCHIAYQDAGTYLKMIVAICEGEIDSVITRRSIDTSFPLHPTTYAFLPGKVGTANGPQDPGWVAPGWYSRTAHVRCQANNSAVDTIDPAPDVAFLIKGRKLMTPDSSGDWTVFAWTNNAADVTRYLLSGGDYYDLDENWLDDDSFYRVWKYNDERIFDKTNTDFAFLELA